MDEVVDLDLLFQIPQEYARIIGGNGEEASSRRSTMVLKNVPKNPKNNGEEGPFYSPSKYDRLGAESSHPVLDPVPTELTTDLPGSSTRCTESHTENAITFASGLRFR